MSEHIFSDEQIRSERRQAYEAGKRQRERWTGRDYHGEEIVRCRDCRHFKPGEEEPPIDWCDWFDGDVTPDGFCAWGAKVVEP